MVLEENGEDKMSEKVSNEQALGRIGERRTLLNDILRRKVNWIGHIQRRNCFLHDAIEGQITEMKGVGRRTQLLDDLAKKTTVYQSNISENYKLSFISPWTC